VNDIEIRRATNADFDAIWDIFQVHVAAGETYTFAPDTLRESGYAYVMYQLLQDPDGWPGHGD
jgi:hypothetical protein